MGGGGEAGEGRAGVTSGCTVLRYNYVLHGLGLKNQAVLG